MRIRKKTRGSIIIAIFFMVICSFMAFAYLTLIPMDATVTRDSERRQVGSMIAEAGISEGLAFLEEGGNYKDYKKATPLVSQSNDLPGKWSYQVYFEDKGNDAEIPDGILRVTSRAQSYSKTWLQSRAYVRSIDDRFFPDMMRASNGIKLPAGMKTEYFDSVHSNDGLEIDYGNGYANLPTFHDKVTWSKTTQFEPLITGNKNNDQVKWTLVNSLNTNDKSSSPGFAGPVPKRDMPDLDPSSSNNIFNGSSKADNFLALTLNKGPAPTALGVTAIKGGGIFVNGDSDISKIEFSLVKDPTKTVPDLLKPSTSGGEKVVPKFDKNAATNDMWQNAPGYTASKTNAESSAGLHQMMTFKYANTNTYHVVFDETNKKTYVFLGNTKIHEVDGLSNKQIWIDDDKKVLDMEGPNKGNKAIAAYDAAVSLDSATDLPPFRADVEPAIVDGGYGNKSYKPNTDANAKRDGFTIATRNTFQITTSGAKLDTIFQYFNILSFRDITFAISAQSGFEFLVAGSMYSMGQIKMDQTSNDNFRFAQDPGNLTFPGFNGKPDYSILLYQEDFHRGGEKN